MKSRGKIHPSDTDIGPLTPAGGLLCALATAALGRDGGVATEIRISRGRIRVSLCCRRRRASARLLLAKGTTPAAFCADFTARQAKAAEAIGGKP